MLEVYIQANTLNESIVVGKSSLPEELAKRQQAGAEWMADLHKPSAANLGLALPLLALLFRVQIILEERVRGV